MPTAWGHASFLPGGARDWFVAWLVPFRGTRPTPCDVDSPTVASGWTERSNHALTVPRVSRVPRLCWTLAQAEEDFTKALEDLQIKWKAGPHEKAAFDELSEQASEELKRAEERVRMVCGEVLAGEAAKEMKWSTRVDTCTKAWEKDVYPESVEKPETEREIKPGTEKGKQKDSDEVRRSWQEGQGHHVATREDATSHSLL